MNTTTPPGNTPHETHDSRRSASLFALSATVSAQKLTYEEAKARIPSQELPDFWIGTIDGLADRWEQLQHGKATTIATSPGGHPLHLIAFGERENVPHKANFNSAVGGKDLAAYMDKGAREKPVVYFVGPVHGHEVEGLTGLVNLIQVMETGRDLRGKDQTSLQAVGPAVPVADRACRQSGRDRALRAAGLPRA